MFYLLYFFINIHSKTVLVLHRSNPMLYVSYKDELILLNEHYKNPSEDKNNSVKLDDDLFLVNENVFCDNGENKSLKICKNGTWKSNRMFNIVKLESKGLCLSVNNYNYKNNKSQELTLKSCSSSKYQLFSTIEIPSSDFDDDILLYS